MKTDSLGMWWDLKFWIFDAAGPWAHAEYRATRRYMPQAGWWPFPITGRTRGKRGSVCTQHVTSYPSREGLHCRESLSPPCPQEAAQKGLRSIHHGAWAHPGPRWGQIKRSLGLACLWMEVYISQDLHNSPAESEKQLRAAICIPWVRFTRKNQRSRLSHVISWLKASAHTAHLLDKVFVAVGEIWTFSDKGDQSLLLFKCHVHLSAKGLQSVSCVWISKSAEFRKVPGTRASLSLMENVYNWISCSKSYARQPIVIQSGFYCKKQ